MKTKLTLGWIIVVTGTLFLLSGLVVMIFATLIPGVEGPAGVEPSSPSFWVSLANAIMSFIIELLEVEWTPIRVGVFMVVIGLILDGGGAYLLISGEEKPKPKKTRGRSNSKSRQK